MMKICLIVLVCACALAQAGVVPVSLPYVATVGTSYTAHSINHAVAAPVAAPIVAAPLAAYSAHPLAYAAHPYSAYPYSAYPYAAAYPGHAAYIAG